MLHKERFLATIHNAPVDRPASWLDLTVPAAEPGLKKYFRVNSIHKLKELINDNIYPVEVPHNYPTSNHIACAFDFAKKKHLDKPDNRI
jgi:uroporphyrinogen decarboxylase